jgi:C_GCAxxG_C_C family probable redox protein
VLKKLIEQGYYPKEDLSCSETILYGANKAYDLGLPKDCLKLSSAFGGGMGVENVCGVITGSLMVLGYLFVKEHAHQSPEIKDLSKELFNLFEKEFGEITCKPLKDKYRTEEKKCYNIILRGAEILDEVVIREKRKRKMI